MACRHTPPHRPGQCMDSTHRVSPSNIVAIIVSFRSCAVFACSICCCPVSAPSHLVVPCPLRLAASAFPKLWAGMTGSDSEGAGHVFQAELATFKQDMADEVAVLQAALQRTVDDIVDATCPHAPGGRGGASGLGP